MPNRSWIIDIENEKVFSLPNVQSHHALERLLQISGRDGEIFIPNLVGKAGKKEVKKLTNSERLFLLNELRDFNQFMLNNLAFAFREDFLEIFYDKKLIEKMDNTLDNHYRYYNLSRIYNKDFILYHWLRGELPVIPSSEDIISVLGLNLLDTPNFLNEYRKFNSFLRSSIESFKKEIAPNLRENRVRELLKNLEV